MKRAWLNSLLAYPPSAATAIRKVEPGARKVDGRLFVSACRRPEFCLSWTCLEASPRIRKADGRRSEGVGDARKVIGRCLPAASRCREFRALDDKRLKSTPEGVPKAVGRWAAGTEGGAKAPACDGGANFIEGVMA